MIPLHALFAKSLRALFADHDEFLAYSCLFLKCYSINNVLTLNLMTRVRLLFLVYFK